MFSVVIPAFNCEKTIGRTLDSVFCQTRLDLIEEIIVINDGSTDKTESVVLSYANKDVGHLIQYVSQENKGVSYSRNRGIRRAKARWIALLDADDEWLPKKIERQYQEIEAHGAQMKFLGTKWPLKVFFRNRSRVVRLTAKELCIRSMPSTPSVVFEKASGEKLGLFDETMQYSEDINFFQKFLLIDSYFILAEDLVRIDVGKKFSADSGLSSHLREMHEGRNKSARELFEYGLISRRFLYAIFCFNEIKYFRRMLICNINKLKFRILSWGG